MIPQYLNLSLRGGAMARLSILRNAAALSNAPDSLVPPSKRFADWRAARWDTLLARTSELSQGFNGDSAAKTHVWYTHYVGAIFRDERACDTVEGARIKHDGWYCDADCDETIRGLVARLSHGRFIAGYQCSVNGERVYFGDIHESQVQAAYAADEHARVQAEKEKEYNEHHQAAQSLHGDCEAMENDISELFPMRHHARARRELFAIIQVLRAKRATLANDYADIEF